MLQKVLIANRGEIAVRIQRACAALGIRTVAVHSDVDAEALHVRVCDESIVIGGAAPAESYLRQDRILEAAAATGCDAVHPGYGFLSENAGFARKVQAAGLVWIGPPPSAMDAMGDKVSARAHAEAVGVPVAPGTPALPDAEAAVAAAETIGYPVILKASAGGGGMGMQIVHQVKDMVEAFEACTSQAASAFGVPDVFMEKFLTRPRHIEVQVLADEHGHCIHLYERECSIQRRHQKLVEEAPSPALDDDAREAIGAKAVELAQHVGYTNAGTLEFLFQDGQLYFNEMNTRIQVEHPVTELVTGVDLVQWQLRIAAGEPLTLQQEDIRLDGHAFEARINAEDPDADFRPSPGHVNSYAPPQGSGVRIDSGVYEGWTLPAAYDSMVIKLLTHGRDRDHAADRMEAALNALQLEGFPTNRSFHQRLFAHPQFRVADISTRFLEEHDLAGASDAERRRAAALIAALATAPGGGLARVQLVQQTPLVTQRRPGQRIWEGW